MAPLMAPSGAADLASLYPIYLVENHSEMLVGSNGILDTNMSPINPGSYSYNARLFTEQAIDENPFMFAEARNPADDLETVQEKLDEFETLIAGYLDDSTAGSGAGEELLFNEFIEQAAATFDEFSLDLDDNVDAEVAVFESDSQPEFLRRRNQFEAAMFDINAITTTPYIIGLSLIDNERQRRLTSYREKLLLQGSKDKNLFLLQGAQLIAQIQTRDVGLQQTLAAMTADQSRFAYTAYREQDQQDVEYDIGEVTWEMDRLGDRANFLSALQGIPMATKKPSQLATAISTALSTGPQLGMAVGNVTGSPAAGVLTAVIGGALAGVATFA